MTAIIRLATDTDRSKVAPLSATWTAELGIDCDDDSFAERFDEWVEAEGQGGSRVFWLAEDEDDPAEW